MANNRWDEISASELAMMFAWGMLPNEVPQGISGRHKLIEDAQRLQVRNERERANDNRKLLSDAEEEMKHQRIVSENIVPKKAPSRVWCPV